jgi:uncharacterized protein (DUF302 family)
MSLLVDFQPLFCHPNQQGSVMPEEQTHIEIVTKLTTRSVEEAVARFVEIISTRALKLFAIIDQSQEARSVGQDLPDTVMVIFGDPRVGTQVVAAAPLAALDLPLKVLVWSDDEQTKVCYESPASLCARHHLKRDLAIKLDGLNALTDALVAPI